MFVEPLSIALYDNEEYNVNTSIKNMRFNGFFMFVVILKHFSKKMIHELFISSLLINFYRELSILYRIEKEITKTYVIYYFFIVGRLFNHK
jgi:hypothetical protein